MRQRAMVALALAGEPGLLVADEPTTALDVTIQAQILELLLRLRDELGLAVLLITHDLGIVAEVADRALVMYAGEIVEEAPVDRLLSAPEHPYTKALLAVASRRGGGGGAGEAPGDRRHRARAGVLAQGLPLRPALPGRLRSVRRRAPRHRRPSGRTGRLLPCRRGPPVTGAAPSTTVRPAPLLSVRGLAKAFRSSRAVLWGGTRREVRAVSDVSFDLAAGETLALVGESGSGKSTTARLVLRLLAPDRGEVLFDGRDWLSLPLSELNRARRDVGVVFQDPGSSLNPRMNVGAIVGEPLAIHRIGSPAERRERVRALLDAVGLPSQAAERRPGEFSGGQRQRIAIARALATEPQARRPRRTGLRARRLHPRPGPEPPPRAPGDDPFEARVPLHRARSRRREAPGRPDRGHVPRPDRRGGADPGGPRLSAAPLHGPSPRLAARAREERRSGRLAAPESRGGAGLTRQPAARLPVSPPLSARGCRVPGALPGRTDRAGKAGRRFACHDPEPPSGGNFSTVSS